MVWSGAGKQLANFQGDESRTSDVINLQQRRRASLHTFFDRGGYGRVLVGWRRWDKPPLLRNWTKGLCLLPWSFYRADQESLGVSIWSTTVDGDGVIADLSNPIWRVGLVHWMTRTTNIRSQGPQASRNTHRPAAAATVSSAARRFRTRANPIERLIERWWHEAALLGVRDRICRCQSWAQDWPRSAGARLCWGREGRQKQHQDGCSWG